VSLEDASWWCVGQSVPRMIACWSCSNQAAATRSQNCVDCGSLIGWSTSLLWL